MKWQEYLPKKKEECDSRENKIEENPENLPVTLLIQFEGG